jgi:hypothetical protein
MQKPEKVVPSLSQEKRSKRAKPLEYLVQRAAVDPATCWRRVYQLGSKAELLVVVKQPEGLEGPSYVSMITDTASEVVLHWGYCKPGEWGWGAGREQGGVFAWVGAVNWPCSGGCDSGIGWTDGVYRFKGAWRGIGG